MTPRGCRWPPCRRWPATGPASTTGARSRPDCTPCPVHDHHRRPRHPLPPPPLPACRRAPPHRHPRLAGSIIGQLKIIGPLTNPTAHGASEADAFDKELPTWAVVATVDKAAGTDVIRSMAKRAGAKITEVEGSHVVVISKPQAVTDVILEAAATVG
jgi:hypothetical protein